MHDKEMERNVKKKTLLYVLAAAIFSMLVASWYATQQVAALCAYSPMLGFNIAHIYFPWQYFIWCYTPEIAALIPQILLGQERWFYIALLPLAPLGYTIQKSLRVNISHGSASWAQPEDIDASGLGLYEEKKEPRNIFGIIPIIKKQKNLKNNGVVVGINPYTNKIMLHDGPEHILLMAPTRSGKGVNTIIPTGLIWHHSIFFFDVKKELWQSTAAYRRKVLKQKVMKFEPLCSDGSTARWNPLAEVEFQTAREINDVSTIVEIMVRPDGTKKGGDDFWPDSAATLLKGVILHLLYAHYQEGKPLPCPTDIMSFLSSPDKSTQELFQGMKTYPHISPDEFMSDHNVLYEIYGEYIHDWRIVNKNLAKWKHPPVHSIQEVKSAIAMYRKSTQKDIDWLAPPWSTLLAHPKVAECAANMLNGAEQTRASIMQTAQTAMALYQNPIVQKNTAVSDFTIRDLLDPAGAVSMYLCMEVDDVATVKPLSRLFINTILSKLIRNMKFDVNQSAKSAGKQRLLLMLDEFPQLGNMSKIELALAVCAGYGIKMCIVSQDVNQLNKEYTKDNSISSNCHVHIYFTPNLDNGGATAKAISEALGKKTISTVSHSDGGGWLKGSDSTSSTARDLMTPDEVSRLSSEEEIVFLAGHKPIRGKKLRYYLFPWFTKRILPEPLYSDTCTTISSYEDLFKVHEAERQELEQRIAEVKEQKAHILLDSARDEKIKADHAVQEAQKQLEALKRRYENNPIDKETFHCIEAAEGQLAIAENTKKIAAAHIEIYDSRLRLVTLEILISQMRTEKNMASRTKTFVEADIKLQHAQKEYEDAKKHLADMLIEEERVTKMVAADNRQIKAQMNLLAVLEQFEGTKKNAETIFNEAEKRKQNHDDVEGKKELVQRQNVAKAMLDIATSAKLSAEKEFAEAKHAYHIIVEALKQENGSKMNILDTSEKNEDIEDVSKEDDSFPDKDFDANCAESVWGEDPADSESDDGDIKFPYYEEQEMEEDNDGDENYTNEIEAAAQEEIYTQSNISDDGQETLNDGAWREGEESEQKVAAASGISENFSDSVEEDEDEMDPLAALLLYPNKKDASNDEGGV